MRVEGNKDQPESSRHKKVKGGRILLNLIEQWAIFILKLPQ